MIKQRQLAVLTAVFLVLFVAGVVKKINHERRERIEEKKAATANTQVFNRDLATAFVTGLEVWHGDDEKSKITAKKDAATSAWSVTSHYGLPAKQYMVDELLKLSANIKGEVRSNSRDVLEDFQITDEQGIHLLLRGTEDKELTHLVVSPLRVAYDNFVRRAGDPTVIFSKNDILSQLGIYKKEDRIETKSFIDLKVVSFESDKVTRLEFRPAGAAPLVLVKKEIEKEDKTKEKIWVFEPEDKSTEIDTSKVSSFFSSLSNLYGKEPVDPKSSDTGIGEGAAPWVKLTLTKDSAAEEISLFLGKKDEEKKAYTVKVSPKGFVHLVTDSSLDSIQKKDKASFLKKPEEKK